MKKVILDLCGGTGAWSAPYRQAGYSVKLITLPHYDVTKVNIDVMERRITFLAQTDSVPDISLKIAGIHGILAAPPCTEFSLARHTLTRPKFLQALEAVEACERIIRTTRAIGYLKFWAMENPQGYLRQFLGIPRYTFEHWQFGEMWCKPTDLWGYFAIPKATVAERPDMPKQFDNTREGGKNFVGWSKPPKALPHLNLTRADLRAMTPAGFAQAFYEANK